MFIVPITLVSCASRGEACSESTTSRASTTVSISAASTIRRSSACCSPDPHELGALELAVGSSGLTPMIASTAGSCSIAWASRPPQYVEMPVTRTLHPSHTDRRWETRSTSSSWIRERMSSATVCTSPLSSHGRSPHWSVGIGSRKRMRNLAGR